MIKNKKATVEYYRDIKVTEQYEKLRFGDDVGRYMHQKEVKIFFEEVPPIKGLRILEVGSGTGRFTIEFIKNGACTISLDSSKGMLNILKSKINIHPLYKNFNLILGDAEHLPFRDSSIEIVFSAYTINHIPNYMRVLKEICRVTSNYVIVIVPYFISILAPLPLIINPLRKLLKRLPVFSKYFLPKDILKVLTNNNLKVRQRGVYLIPPKVLSLKLLPHSIVTLLDKLSPLLEGVLGKLYAVQVSIGHK